MAEESATPDLVELVRQSSDALSRRDFDAMMSVFGADAVWDLSPMGLGLYEGPAAIRAFAEDWLTSYDQFENKTEEVLDLGNGVTFGVASQVARIHGSSGEVTFHYASVGVWEDGLFARVTNYLDIDEARAAAERLAQERG